MEQIRNEIINCLTDIKGGGKFVSIRTKEFVFPGLEVGDLGEIPYPINPLQAKALIQIAHKAPFGKGSETILDQKVRSGWEIDTERLRFKGAQWDAFLDKALAQVKEDLGLENYTVSANLYKMLIYEKGDFFLPHKDSEKETGMFGTMVVGLPSHYTGGELVVTFDGLEEIADFSKASADHKINITAFYADCDHEVKPLSWGHRVCLVYNLIQGKSENEIQHSSLNAYAMQLAELFTRPTQSGDVEPYTVLLGHQYTPENFSVDTLKLNDRPKAAALFLAAQKANCYAKMCLVTSYISGSPAYNGYGYDDEPDEDSEMEEIFDQSLSITHWLGNDLPGLSNVSFEEGDLIASFALDEGEPIVKESTGYMGNYGPDLMHWYHYGAVMVWSKEVNSQLLLKQNTASQLEWIKFFCDNPDKISVAEIGAVDTILAGGLNIASEDKETNFNSIVDWVISRKNEPFFLNLDPRTLQLYFVRIEAEYWLKLMAFLGEKVVKEVFDRVMNDVDTKVLEQLFAILSSTLDDGRFNDLAVSHIKEVPTYLKASSEVSKIQPRIGTEAMQNLLLISQKAPQGEAWTNAITKIFIGYSDRKFINQILVPSLLELNKQTGLSTGLLIACRRHFQLVADNEPQPPVDWSRQVPENTHYKEQWALLKSFLESPVESVFDYRKAQEERGKMESAIANAEVDLQAETIKKGSPYTLRLTKTQASFAKRLNEWKEDMVWRDKVIRKLGA